MATGFSYDVFLSFRGEDTRTTFTDHLYAALKQAGVRTFRDDDAMDRGRLLGPELKKAIRESAISVIVFSRNYTSSKWCLDEVLTIIQEQERMSSKHEVVPVFYKVDPSDIWNQTGSFEEAFGRYDVMIEAETDDGKKIEWVEKVKAWRDALKKAGSLTGMVLTANGHEAEFIGSIVSVIRKKLNYNLLYIEGKLVGIKDKVVEIESWIQDPSPDAVFLFIHGMGGIGKTTISKCIYNSNSHEYDVGCFLANIQETSNQPNGLVRLQRQLLSTILRSDKEEVIWNLDEGIVKVTNALCNKKVLLILDDIATSQQLTALLGSQQFYPGSKVIISTRNKGLLTEFKTHPKVRAIEELGPGDSNKLFSLYAFDRDHPVEPYIAHSKLVADRCGGHPLALKVLGSSLKGKTIDVWEDAMRKLEAIPNPDIQKVLQLSYDTLEDTTDKDLFLHIACFFVGEDKEFIVKLLAECNMYPTVGIENLMDRCLLSIEDEKVTMHQLIKEMGREVVRQESPMDPGKRSRLWRHQDSFNVLKEKGGTKKVEGLALDMQMINGINSTSLVKMDSGRKRSYEDFGCLNKENFKIRAIEKMKNLMLLQLDYATFSGSYKKLPKNLRLLRWHGFPLKFIPNDVPLQKLVVLDLRHSKLKKLWDGFMVVGSLKILNLSFSVELIKTPNFGGLPGLESLLLEGCLRLTQVCESIGYLQRLVSLDISGCRSLKGIPCLPTSLESLKMNDCPKIYLGGPRQVKCLDSCSLLVDIDISGCNLFDISFPEDWSNFFSLKILDISRNHITSLPGCIKSLPCLEELTASDCSHLQSVLDLPKSVTNLNIYQNMSLEVVQLTATPLAFMSFIECEKLYEVAGCFKVESIKNVDRKVIRYLGLENAYREDESIKVSYEFGIYSAFVLGKTLPCFSYKEFGSKISFRVPSHPKGSRISGLNVCFMATSKSERSVIYEVEVNNKTKVLVWQYAPTIYSVRCNKRGDFSYVWLSLWRTGNLLDDGDEIVVSIKLYDPSVEECCVNLVYDDDAEEEMDVVLLNGISWTDRMLVEVSDYVHTGKTYYFATYDPYATVDWWGLREEDGRQITVFTRKWLGYERGSKFRMHFLGGPGQVQCLDSCSLLVEINVSGCNLTDNSFPENWSNLFSLKRLDISSNHITSLPGCVKTLTGLEKLIVCSCSHLQLVLDVPKSVKYLDTSRNISLEVVQPIVNPYIILKIGGCEILCEVECCYKHESIKKVDRKVLRYLGLENAYTEEDESIKVSYEFGIFSTVVPWKTLPCFMYKEIGSTISFRVPPHPNGSRISGLSVCFMYTSKYGRSIIEGIEINNKTKALVWYYTPTMAYATRKREGDFKYVWLSLWRTGNLLDDGDEIAVSNRLYYKDDVLEECCVNMMYDDDDEEEEIDVVLSNRISWTDRMWVEVSDHVHSGERYHFTNFDSIYGLRSHRDWWGSKENRNLFAGVSLRL